MNPNFPLMLEMLSRAGWNRRRIAKKLGIHENTVNQWGRLNTTPQTRNLFPLLGIAKKVLSDEDFDRCVINGGA